MATLPHFIQYQGSKRTLAKHILQFLPKKIGRLVEPFAGTAAMSVATSANQMTRSFWLNDLNKPLIELLELAIEKPNEIADFYLDLWNEQHPDSIAHYFEVRSRFNENNDPKLFLYLLARCVKGSVRYNSEGRFNQSPDKRRKGTRPETMRRNIVGVSSLLKGRCKFTNWDYQEVLEQIQEGDFIYIDPPYQGVCGNRDSRYLSGINFDDFVLVIEHLNRKKAAFAISYDGKLGDKTFGKILPKSLNLERIEIKVGRSSQSTLLGKEETTIESLYLSSTLSRRLATNQINNLRYTSGKSKQLTLLEKHGEFAATTR
ncbi:DNA adenine methylase [Desertifilum sp. FACHB-1129]|uniref:Site-specific DNA-methyltransferase (adenine-specific) n=1 Tax=Desertifilum tharense IPPAS B-1220 TaxID=1781255 RepID=A0A1E5QHR2_9CYAN|nr:MULTISPECIES: DNA adenine methylase [Desertifilum]MDA0211294.1 DNA adenine methylase [Cyanobacteria bacterium FC1]MBD2314684.1 DNA adenine methylase [Desertifilum sp. FACHB-1129]MBD2320256.1 DNA adenine methylase [Desertifilum sp. FACHB-866]MBD2330384.1 DNA adenine methylase [Desertifilum sp. FACHB-868]OEJ74151.1 DNA adenine methylase [Desertifilum tharense IPPAS B-1220]